MAVVELVLGSEEFIVGYVGGIWGVLHCCVIDEDVEDSKSDEEREDSVCCAVLTRKEFLLLGIECTVKTSVAAGGSNFILHPSIIASKTSRYA